VNEAQELVAALVAIDSVNPGLAAGAAGEAHVAALVADWLADGGLDVSVEEIAPGRPNVVGRAAGSGGGSSLLLLGHTDTVGTETMTSAFEPRVDAGRLYGRGAYDMKGGLAAAMLAAREAARLGLAGDVVVAAVVDEEAGSLGTEALLRSVTADAAIVAEPTELELVVAHKGFVGFEVELRGHAAHGSRPDLGIDAIAQMGPVLTAIGSLDASLADRPLHPLLGRGSVHASTIRGGQEFSTYPERCVVTGERRTLPGEDRDTVSAELRDLVEDAAGSDADLRLPWARDPFELHAEHYLVGVARAAATAVLGARPRLAGRGYWTDAALLCEAGVPTVVFGPGGAGAHAAVEWVELADVDAVARVLVETARRLCT
jgi:acetylornithine deacetylase